VTKSTAVHGIEHRGLEHSCAILQTQSISIKLPIASSIDAVQPRDFDKDHK